MMIYWLLTPLCAGFFAETDRQVEQVPSPFAGEKGSYYFDMYPIRASSLNGDVLDKALRPIATSIYYLLTPDEPNGVFHMNKSAVGDCA